MKVGDLCRVTVSWSHSTSQLNDLVLLIDNIGASDINPGATYFKGLNIKTDKFHHYHIKELEVISEYN